MGFYCRPCGETHGRLDQCRRPDLHMSTKVDNVKKNVEKKPKPLTRIEQLLAKARVK
jgi:hypothetical protein